MTKTPREATQPDDASALPMAEVEQLLSTMGKALRAFNMYQANNPVFQRFREALRDAFQAVWARTDELPLSVVEDGFRYGGRTFAVGKGRENIAFAFYKDGVRNLTFLPGFEDEVGAFLDAVTRAGRAGDEADDLITVLWEEDFGSLLYGYVDLLMEGVPIPEEPQAEPGPVAGGFAGEAEVPEGGAGEEVEGAPAGSHGPLTAGLTRDDFDETLYFLDQAEIARLQTEVEVEMERDLRVDVLNALFDRLEEPRPDRQEQILDILDQLMPLFLSRGDMANAARVLEELERLQHDGRRLGASLQERVERLFARLSEPQVLEQFVQAVEDGAVAPDSEGVNLFFSRLEARALPVLLRFAEMSESETVKKRLASAVDGLASRYPGEVNELLRSDEPAMVAGAARVAGRVGLKDVVEGLDAALGHADRNVRMAVVEALVAIRSTTALNALSLALEDEDREVRIAAASALGEVRFASARRALERVIEGRRIKEADLTEKMAFFEAYGAAGGSTAVERLDRLLNSKGFLGRRNPTEIRACAALGLGQAGTPRARAALEKARSDEDSIVRNAVVRALKQEMVSP
ncbi:MAG: HEAT repeat domain-containing protein [Gemmatimonadota bacterium]